MAFLRVEKKTSGTYLRIVQSYKDKGVPRHKTLHSLGKIEDYPPHQLETIAKKLLQLAGVALEDFNVKGFKEVGRYNYGYALVIKQLWKLFDMNAFVKRINAKRKIRLDWMSSIQLMIAERLNEPCSKRQSFFNQEEYLGWDKQQLQHFYRSLTLLGEHQEELKKHIFTQQQSLFSQALDLVFYDVTTLYFDSQVEEAGKLRQKGYCKDGKAHKTKVVLGLLVDKLRNPLSYHIYKGGTYEGKTFQEAIRALKTNFKIDQVIAVADSAMIDQDNRAFIENSTGMDYIIGDPIKMLPKAIQDKLLNKTQHTAIKGSDKETFSYCTTQYKGRKILCTYSAKRARKDAFQREKLIEKAQRMIQNPAQYKQSKKKGAGRFITTQENSQTLRLNTQKIEADKRFDGFKAIATSTDLKAEELLEKYRDLYKVEQAFRTLKSQLQIRPMFHWTDKRIEGHIAMCFIAFTFLNHMKNLTKLSERELVRTLDRMQMSAIQEGESKELVYMKSKNTDNQDIISKKLKLVVPRDVNPQRVVNQILK